MTAPRQLLEGTTYLVTRRCLGRRFMLRPDKLTNRIVAYVLARAAGRARVRVHAYCVMSNHLHLVVTDPSASLPRFLQELDSLVGRSLNARYGQWGYFWEAGSYHALELDGPDQILDRCAYVLANPVAAGLVPRARKWPGLWSAPESVGEEVEFERPNHFFKPDGGTPAKVRLRLRVPPGFSSAEDFRARLAAAVAAREARATGERRSFLGVARILRQRILASPVSKETRRRERPRFAARDEEGRQELLARLRAFLAEYQVALEAWREGRRSAVFPAGTYQMRVAHQVVCAGAG